MYRCFLKVRKLKAVEHLLPVPALFSTIPALKKENEQREKAASSSGSGLETVSKDFTGLNPRALEKQIPAFAGMKIQRSWSPA